MEFNIDNIVSGAKDLFDKASAKAGEAIDYSKVQIDRSQLRVKLKEKYTELGKAYYAEKMSGADRSAAIGTLVDEITELKAKLEETETKKNKTCPKCGAECAKDIAFCGKCGAKLDV
ncbi:MAG: zinc ribbon domain-containing protein [Oscillospiraceae bacterium]|nr:zinc ribbon domain-containing protein [Oscillospiraceae bacterium]